MRKYFIYAVLIIIFLGILSSAFAFDNEPKGFRGLKWGSSPTEDMQLFEPNQDNPVRYIRPDDKLKLGEANLIAVVYIFYKAQYKKVLVSVALHFAGEENWQLLKEICKQKFGKPYQDQFDSIIWMSQKSTVALDWNFLEHKGILMLADIERLVKYENARQKAKSREAEKDW